MLERLTGLPDLVEGVRAAGKVSKEDYERVFEPLLEEARRAGRRVFLLYEIGPGFEGFTPGAAWEDAKLGMRFMKLFEGCAVVSDVLWIRDLTRAFGFLMPCPVRVFDSAGRSAAIEWLASLARDRTPRPPRGAPEVVAVP
ncbi:MAG TPA: STAS/SEC14 domain-containing protein [Thermoanaerobaculia bacterium]|nr:STAS/SEC14 domain-containing protein [Thermoanaerobaculia bacterium]